MSEDEKTISVVDTAYEIIVGSDRAWTTDELISSLARAGFPIEDDGELETILDAVRERIENENIVTDAIENFLRDSGFQDLRHAAQEMDCAAEEIVEMIAAKANIFGKPH